MNIIFIDGKIPIDGDKYSDRFKNAFEEAFDDLNIIVNVDAAYGVNKCQEKIEDCLANDVRYVITNDIISWGNQEYSWDDVENKCCAYIYYDDLGEIFNVEELTDKEIRKSNNLEKMYLNGAFTKPHKLNLVASKIINIVKDSADNKKVERDITNIIANSDFLPLGAFLRKLTENPWVRVFEVDSSQCKFLSIHNGWLESMKNEEFINNYLICNFDIYDDAVELYVKHM